MLKKELGFVVWAVYLGVSSCCAPQTKSSVKLRSSVSASSTGTMSNASSVSFAKSGKPSGRASLPSITTSRHSSKQSTKRVSRSIKKRAARTPLKENLYEIHLKLKATEEKERELAGLQIRADRVGKRQEIQALYTELANLYSNGSTLTKHVGERGWYNGMAENFRSRARGAMSRSE